ncbi:MAG: PorP/SprF family type IX secretion system membrane protein [Chitinophagales bacterium]|nr:PorP/SprF family type IX secretion system membrane protein [Chitinophagales bacterium]MDW8274141.1 PorP/SprF family type IX secretion system membrane protein [Chitinophagales bacterium]
MGSKVHIKICFFVMILLALLRPTKAQYIHFSQFGFVPLYASPAYTNLMDGDFRFNAVYRNQWASVPVNYNTVGATAEMNFFQFEKGSRLGGGLQFFYDRAGDSRFTYMQAALPLSGTVRFAKRHWVAAAVAPGFIYRNFDPSQLNFDNQFTGDAFDPSVNPNESFPRTASFDFDISLGLAYQYLKNPRSGLLFGIYYGHINQPALSFFNDSELRMGSIFSAHLRGTVKLIERLDVVPEYFYRFQAASVFLGDVNIQEHLTGLFFRTYLEYTLKRRIALNTGVYSRLNPRRKTVSLSNRIIEAVYPLVGIEVNAFKANISYDINLSSFTPATRNNGGFEITLSYEISRVKKIRKNIASCPAFL